MRVTYKKQNREKNFAERTHISKASRKVMKGKEVSIKLLDNGKHKKQFHRCHYKRRSHTGSDVQEGASSLSLHVAC